MNQKRFTFIIRGVGHFAGHGQRFPDDRHPGQSPMRVTGLFLQELPRNPGAGPGQ